MPETGTQATTDPQDASAGPARVLDAADILESALDGIVALDNAGVIRMCNAASVSLLDLGDPSSAVGRPFDGIVPAPPGEQWSLVVALVASGSIFAPYETQVQTAAGALDVVIRVSPIGHAPDVRGASVQIRDITERKSLEREVTTKAADLKRLNADLERSNRDLERFAYAASHDMQEPLRMVHSYVALLARSYEGQLDAEADRFIHFAMDGAERMRLMIDSLLELSRVMRAPLSLEPVSLADVVADVVKDLEPQIHETGATVTYGDLPIVNGDATQLRRLMQNLISNAMKYRSKDPIVIRVHATAGDDGWTVSTTDNGRGIAEESRDEVFEPFKRLNRHRSAAGSGIGLAISRAIVERFGGQIWNEAADDEGTTFSFTIQERASS